MRILHVVPTYAPAWRYGGTIRSVHGLCAALAARGHQVHVYTTNVDGPGESPAPLDRPVEMDGVQVRYHRSPALRRLYWSPDLGRRFRAETALFDVVHLHSVFLWPTAAAARQARRAGVPYVVSPRGMMVKDLFRLKSGMAKALWTACVERGNLERAAAVHATSALEARELEAFGFRLKRVFVLPNGVDLPAPAAPVAKPQRPFVLYLGRISWKKGLDRLIRAMASVPQADLVLAGNDEEGYTDALASIARRSGVSSRVRFIGEVRGGEKSALLRTAALFALPSHSENFGNAALEAMAEGCPVLVSEGVGLAETVRDEKCGEVCPNEPAAIAASIGRLLGDPRELERMGEAGRRAAETRFGWDRIAGLMEREYAALRKR